MNVISASFVSARRVDRGVVVVWDVVADDGTAWQRRLHAASLDDRSGPHPIHMGPGGYDHRCSWCWLGAPHTELAHEQSVATVSP